MSKIMVLPAKELNLIPRDVLVTDADHVAHALLLAAEARDWVERECAEKDAGWRQPIPYVLMSSGVPTLHVLMQRMKGQGEKRLLGKQYLGAGGHVEEGHGVLYTALKEVTEELGLPIATINLKGIIISTGGPVEDVHVGFFYHAWTNYTHFNSPEGHLHNARWLEHNDIKPHIPEMEKWSQIVARDYLKLKV